MRASHRILAAAATALLAAALNLIAVAALGPLLALALRRRRTDLPKVVAQDYAGTAMLLLMLAVFVVAGVLHAPERADAERDYTAQIHAAAEYIRTQAPAEYRDGTAAMTRSRSTTWWRESTLITRPADAGGTTDPSSSPGAASNRTFGSPAAAARSRANST